MVGHLAMIFLLECYAILFAGTVLGVCLGYLVVPFRWPLTLMLVLLPFGFALVHACRSMGYRRGLLLMSLAVAASLLTESVGVLTAAVFGPYHYTPVLGPRFLGLVPYTVPMVWFALVYPSYVVAEWLVPVGWVGRRRRLAVAGLGATVVTAVDMALDPVMVEAGAWVWQVHGAFFGIPLQNYVGWWLTAFAILGLYQWSCAIRLPQPPAGSAALARLALFSYGLFAFGAVGTALHMKLAGPALAAMLAIGPWVTAGLWSMRRTRQVAQVVTPAGSLTKHSA